VEEHGLAYHTADGRPYWDESACYQFTAFEINSLAHATNTLHRMCLDLVQEVIAERLFGLFLIPPELEAFVVRSWEEREPSVYGRFDLTYDGVGAPQLLEYNADTPIALLEAAITQAVWLKDTDERAEQFNTIDERLIEVWSAFRERELGPVHFAALSDNIEEYITTEYLRDAAVRAGLDTIYLDIREVGWDHARRLFVDAVGYPIQRLFKLYPWDLMAKEDFARHLPFAPTRWVEPAWKTILDCKSILPLLWERHPDCPFLPAASFDPLSGGSWVRKPIRGREGANIQVVIDGKLVLETDGPYVGGPYVYQTLAASKTHDGKYPVIGSWVVNGVSCGIGIREDDGLVTGETCRFVPHVMVG
ncbi:MAG TPA: glutathionylspermidine synthase family protein, partial [Gemmataceae bacterium]|nr:glutathionylspermidine synthase family protein [Gemmataceae bacterium]